MHSSEEEGFAVQSHAWHRQDAVLAGPSADVSEALVVTMLLHRAQRSDRYSDGGLQNQVRAVL